MYPTLIRIAVWLIATLIDIFLIPILRKLAKSTTATEVDDRAVEWAHQILKQLRRIPTKE